MSSRNSSKPSLNTPPGWPSGKASASRAAHQGSIATFAVDLFSRSGHTTDQGEQNSMVSDQNGVSLLHIMFEIHHSGWEPSKCSNDLYSPYLQDFFSVSSLTIINHHKHLSCFVQPYTGMTAQVLAFP